MKIEIEVSEEVVAAILEKMDRFDRSAFLRKLLRDYCFNCGDTMNWRESCSGCGRRNPDILEDD